MSNTINSLLAAVLASLPLGAWAQGAALPGSAGSASPASPPGNALPLSHTQSPNAATRAGAVQPQVVETPPTLGTLSQSIASPRVPAAWTRFTIAVAPCSVPPKIDGSLNDVCWQTATHAAGFFPLVTSTAISPADQTECWICADKTHLYVAFHCLDSHPTTIHASETVRDSSGVFQDDYVGFDVDSQNSRHNYSSFYVNARGTQTESYEGGTSDNITWAGDWKGAAQRTADGWTAEMSIPFALLRYPRGAKAFGLDFYRYLPRNSTYQNWPYLPPQGAAGGEGEYIGEFTGIAPPFFAPRPVFLPYTLASAGTGNSVREGMDIKYPLTTTLTGVASLFPDFQTIEQDVTTINFSYDEKLLTDRRPFFAEGSGFFPYQDLFYSRQINSFDGGLKVAGKQDNTTVGFLTTGARGTDAQSTGVLNLQQDIGLFSHVLFDAVDDLQLGQPSNQVEKLEGVYGWEAGPTHFALQADHAGSQVAGHTEDSEDFYQFGNTPVNGSLGYNFAYQDIGPNFVSNLGYVPELDLHGPSVSLYQYNQFDKGALRSYYVSASADTYQHDTGGFFHDDYSLSGGISTRAGLKYGAGVSGDRRNQIDSVSGLLDKFDDYAPNFSFSWGQKTLYQQGSASDTVGRQAGQNYNFLTIAQGVFVQRPFNLQLNYSRLALGDTTSTQSIATGTYRLSATRTIGARIVNQTGVDQGTGLGTDIYFSFGQHVRTGDDIYVLFGDPNSPTTRGKVTLKIIRPF